MNSVKVVTEFNKDKIIQYDKFDVDDVLNGTNLQSQVKRIMDLRDQGVREALIKLGWTPPKEDVGA